MFDIRFICLPSQSHTRAHEHRQLAILLAGRTGFEVNGCGREICRMCACLMPDEVGHVFTGVGDNRVLIIDLGEDNPTSEDPDLLMRLFEALRYPTLGVDLQNSLSHADAELACYGNGPLLTRTPGGALIRALYLRLSGEQQSLAASEPLDPEHLDTHIVRNLARRTMVAELVQVACLSSNHFHVQFKDSVDLTLRQYPLRARLDYTVWLLRESRLPLVRIAEECGFSS